MHNLDFYSTLQDLLPLLSAAIIGLVIGLERGLSGKPASIRTFTLLCIGSALFTKLSVDIAVSAVSGTEQADIGRIASNIVTGVGFLGGGVIFKANNSIKGITTGAVIWVTAAIGMACGFERYSLAVFSLMLYLITMLCGLRMHRLVDPLAKPTGGSTRKVNKVRES